LRTFVLAAESVLEKNKVHSLILIQSVLACSLAAACAHADCPPENETVTPVIPRIAKHSGAYAPTDQAIEVTSQGGELSLSGDATLTGKVQARQGERIVTAENAQYDAASGDLTIRGGVQLQDPTLTLRGEGAHIERSGAAQIDAAEFELGTGVGRGTAKHIELNKDGRLGLDDVHYTTCPRGNSDWELKASQISIDQARGSGAARNVLVDFKGVPILYMPALSFPVGNERKSGFLFPNFGTSSLSGTILSTPYYLNLATNYDDTFTPSYLTRRGYEIDNEFRYLTEGSVGTLRGQYLPHDDQFGSDRSFVHFTDRTDLSDHLRFTADASNVSDRTWFEDFGQGPDVTSVTYLNRLAQMTYLDDHWIVVGRAQNFQTIDTLVAAGDKPNLPYTTLPQLTFQGRFPLESYGLDPSIYGEAVHFTRNGQIEGTRVDFMPQIRMPLQTAAMFLVPSIALDFTSYRLSGRPNAASLIGVGTVTDPATGQSLIRDPLTGSLLRQDPVTGTLSLIDRSPSRTAPIFSVDSGVAFERPSGSHAQRIQTLEPRILYTYIPYRNQDNIPVFDTTSPDLNLVQLFRTNRFIGPDRLGDANQLSVGVTSRLLDAASGRQFLAATIGQTYYFTQPRVTLPDEPAPDGNSSDVVAQLEVSAYKNWNVHLGMQWDPQDNQNQKSEVRFQYQPDPDRVVNLAYRYRRDSVEQWDVSTAWPISAKWNGYARMVYSVLDQKMIDRFVGFEYRSCCWSVRVVQRKYVFGRPTDGTNTGRTANSFLVQLELKGLSSVGEPTDAFLERAIRGYSPRPTAGPPTGP
jgi:LPS-assembly protein